MSTRRKPRMPAVVVSGTVDVIIMLHAEDNNSPSFDPWTQASADAWMAETLALLAKAHAKGWPIHIQPSMDLAMLITPEFVTAAKALGATFDARAHRGATYQGKAYNAADVAERLASLGAAFTGVLGSYESAEDYTVPMTAASGGVYWWKVLTCGGNSGHEGDSTLAGYRMTDAGQVEILAGMSQSTAKLTAEIRAANTGVIARAVHTFRANCGSVRAERTPGRTVGFNCTPAGDHNGGSGGLPVLDELSRAISDAGGFASSVRVRTATDAATSWVARGCPSEVYDSAGIGTSSAPAAGVARVRPVAG